MPASLANRSGLGIQKKPLGVQGTCAAEVEHAFDAACENVEGAASDTVSNAPAPCNTNGLTLAYYDGNTVAAMWNYAQH